ncbi:uncharacterized protein LOC135923840 [Gordionus sp. m RMFG-2023]|uniref:uncharacterized protein LOC135923840 n=1 Tax=Gordionus sp. m RMFG-2023 TaxID=3053472 RepID=UPI0031FBDF6B
MTKPVGYISLHLKKCRVYHLVELYQNLSKNLEKIRIEVTVKQHEKGTSKCFEYSCYGGWIYNSDRNKAAPKKRQNFYFEIEQMLMLPIQVGYFKGENNLSTLNEISITLKIVTCMPSAMHKRILLAAGSTPITIGQIDQTDSPNGSFGIEKSSDEMGKNLTSNLITETTMMGINIAGQDTNALIIGEIVLEPALIGRLFGENIVNDECLLAKLGKRVSAFLDLDMVFIYGSLGCGHSNYLIRPSDIKSQKNSSVSKDERCMISFFPGAEIPKDRKCPESGLYLPKLTERNKISSKDPEMTEKMKSNYPLIYKKLNKWTGKGWNEYKKCQSRAERLNYLNALAI